MFDSDKHRLAESRYFGDFSLGEEFYLPSRTMTSALFAAFQLASGDNHPSHYDVEYCKRRGHPGLLAHGMQVFIQSAAGAGLFPHLVDDSMKGFIDMSASMKRPVYEGDTLYPLLQVSDLKQQNTTGLITLAVTIHNQHGELVLTGSHTYLLARKAD